MREKREREFEREKENLSGREERESSYGERENENLREREERGEDRGFESEG